MSAENREHYPVAIRTKDTNNQVKDFVIEGKRHLHECIEATFSRYDGGFEGVRSIANYVEYLEEVEDLFVETKNAEFDDLDMNSWGGYYLDKSKWGN